MICGVYGKHFPLHFCTNFRTFPYNSVFLDQVVMVTNTQVASIALTIELENGKKI